MYAVEEQLWWFRGLRDVITETLQRNVPVNSKIADAGCGTGINSQMLKGLGYEVESFDLSDQAIMYCKKRGIEKAQVGSVTKMPIKSSSMHALIMMDVLSMLHPDEVRLAINETYRVLKPGGLALFQVAAFEWLRSGHDQVSQVQKRYSIAELEAFFDTKQWQINYKSYRIWLLFPLLACVKILKRVLLSHPNQATGDLWLPPAILNKILFTIQWCENKLLRFFPLPWGSSVFMVVEKKH